MRGQAGEEVMRILPNGFRNDERAFRIEPAKNFQPHFLRIDETVLFLFIEWIRALNFVACALDRVGEQRFHAGLLGPAFFVRGRPEIAAGNEIHGFRIHGARER